MNTIFLHPENWDLTLTEDGDIALAKDLYAKAQDVASAIKLFKGELYYNTEKGIPYFDETLGKKQSFSLYQYRLEKAALTVPEIISASAKIISGDNRKLIGSIFFTDNQNNTLQVQI
ncbi:hypothetical protein EV694_1680 [Volucribacter psittacicida]|uniref:DUF2634 domain-containing protein n=1 Tax=Volucribacter psittacicida TaxID=203482 RepID=A0A4R1FRP2_9PAST|nr:hypothetical protein [Volucribacter psittacicida]TCJ96129.1 hypothetical protein EV694_1680 [Volucribacter psittacicida]